MDDLAADDFETLRAQIAKTYGKLSRKVEIKRVRSIFRYAYEANLIEKPVRFGPGFVGPRRRELRCERQQNGQRMFEAAEIRSMLAAASLPLKAMISLGINCGFGNTDAANLAVRNLDLKGGWCNYPRPKTGISRRCLLWPETVSAIKAALKARPDPRGEHFSLVGGIGLEKSLRIVDKGSPISPIWRKGVPPCPMLRTTTRRRPRR